MPPIKASDYDPKYVVPEDVPLSGPSSADYTESSKLRAIKTAEGTLERRVNGGEEIQEVDDDHWTACAALASYTLVAGSEEPSGQHLGDFADDGGGQSSYTDRMWQLWRETLFGILGIPFEEDKDGDSSGGDDLNHYIRTVN